MVEIEIPKDIRDMCFGYGPFYLSEMMYRYEMEQYKKARDAIKGDPYTPENKQKLRVMEYYSKRCDALHKAWITLQDIEWSYPFSEFMAGR